MLNLQPAAPCHPVHGCLHESRSGAVGVVAVLIAFIHSVCLDLKLLGTREVVCSIYITVTSTAGTRSCLEVLGTSNIVSWLKVQVLQNPGLFFPAGPDSV